MKTVRAIAMIAMGLATVGVAVPAAAQARAGAVDKTFTAWDTDGNGVLSRDEFETGWNGIVARGIAARLRAQFDRLDRNSDGGLDGAEYANLALVMQAGKEAPALEAFDANRDKRLQFDEYVSSVRTLAANRKPGRTQP